MNEISSGEPYRIIELWKYFFAFDIDDEAEWKKDLGVARLLRNHYNVNYKVNLRMFLKVGGESPISVLASNPGAKQKKFSAFLNTKSYN